MTQSDGIAPWERSKFEERASREGIAFERNNKVPHDQALLACDSWAACVIMSDQTAAGLTRKDDDALWAAIARCGVNSTEAVVVNLPSFGDAAVAAIPQSHPAYVLVAHAVSRAQSFMPYEGKVVDPDGDYYFNPDENPRDHWSKYPPYYRRFIEERAPRIRWLDELRFELSQILVHDVIRLRDDEPIQPLKVQRWRAGAIVQNQNGGRVGKLRYHPVAEARLKHGHGDHLEFLLMANEFDRPSAVAALADVGIEVPFDPGPDWLYASVEPGLHGWLNVYWSGSVAGLDLKLEVARFHIQSGELTVFVPGFGEPIEQLLRRVGQLPTQVKVETHPDDPECFYGEEDPASAQAQISVAPRGSSSRKLQPHSAELLPPDWAAQLEIAWRWKNTSTSHGLTDEQCRLCTGSSRQRPYCVDCCEDAERGLFGDRGFDEDWRGAVVWSLQTLAEIEFGGPPAVAQLAEPPADGPNADLLMLCRMLTARWSSPTMGSERKAFAWTDWLAEAGLLTDGFRTSRGVTVMAKDGHICRSLLERQIDDFFSDNGIVHEPEPLYPYDTDHNVGGYRADWKLADGTFVEALGFTNQTEYMAKVEKKLQLAARYQIPVLAVTAADVTKLATIFAKWLPAEVLHPQNVGLPPRPEQL